MDQKNSIQTASYLDKVNQIREESLKTKSTIHVSVHMNAENPKEPTMLKEIKKNETKIYRSGDKLQVKF